MRIPIGGLLFIGMALFVAMTQSGAADDFKPETGFNPIFNGKDLTGWKMKKGGDSLDGKSEAANGRFKAADGILVVDPKVKGDIYIDTAKTFEKDIVIRFDYLPGPKCNNDMLIRGAKFDIKTPDVKNLKEGEWNSFEIVITGDQAEFKNNGETQKTIKLKPGATPFTLRAEAGPIQYRRLRVKE